MAAWPYDTGRWARLRHAKLASTPLCEACERIGRATPASHVDHRVIIASGRPQLTLTHHTLKALGRRPFALGDDGAPKIAPVGEAGSGAVQEKDRAFLAEIIARVNDLFTGDLTEDDQLIYVNDVIKGKMLESATLVSQAANNTKARFAASPTLEHALLALDAHQTMSIPIRRAARVIPPSSTSAISEGKSGNKALSSIRKADG